jgi:4-carboxymuconolactone decarboxylase
MQRLPDGVRMPCRPRAVDVKTRELLTFSMLVALGGCEPQVKGHIAANLNIGNDRSTLLGVITHLLPFVGYARSLNALRVLNEVTGPVLEGVDQ